VRGSAGQVDIAKIEVCRTLLFMHAASSLSADFASHETLRALVVPGMARTMRVELNTAQ
jgi:hypothetical protein